MRRCTYVAWDTSLVRITQGPDRERVMREARKLYEDLKKRGEIGKPGRGTHGIAQHVAVIETCERAGMRFLRRIWFNGRAESSPWIRSR